MKITRIAMLLIGLSATIASSLSGCSPESATPPPAQASGATAPQGPYSLRTGTGIDVLYFEESDACDCMAEVGVVVKNTVNTHFAQALQSGTMRFFVIKSDDWTNKDTFEMFSNQPFDLFIVEFVEEGKGVAVPVYEFWSMMGDDEAIEAYVKARIDESLAKLS
jgi:hypothetical protein